MFDLGAILPILLDQNCPPDQVNKWGYVLYLVKLL